MGTTTRALGSAPGRLTGPARTPPQRGDAGGREATIVIGGGAAGTLVAIKRLAHDERPVVIVERADVVGRGVAYATVDPAHLLNVPAGKLSVAQTSPDDFTRWLRRHDPTAGA